MVNTEVICVEFINEQIINILLKLSQVEQYTKIVLDIFYNIFNGEEIWENLIEF